MPELSISIVSHRQLDLVHCLLDSLKEYCPHLAIEVLLTINVPEPAPFDTQAYPFPVSVFCNPGPRGFGENHNAAFGRSAGTYFCVLNPDVRLVADTFSVLIASLSAAVGVAAPRIINSRGEIEDSARQFPVPGEIFAKVFGGKPALPPQGGAMSEPDWVAGMFMLFPREVFRKIGGFDERYFLYYEDVDICARLRLAGYRVILCPEVSVIHDARRTSHRNLRYMRWHLASMARFFFSNAYRELGRRGLL